MVIKKIRRFAFTITAEHNGARRSFRNEIYHISAARFSPE